jgi:hypothetical protein
VVEKRLLGVHKELVEGEPAGGHLRDAGGQPIDAIGDLVDLRFHDASS